MFGLLLNYYLRFFDLPFHIIVSITIVLGILSLFSILWSKREFVNSIDSKNSSIFKYKRPRVQLTSILIGIIILFTMREADSDIKVLALLIAGYLVSNQIVELVAGIIFKSNILVFTESQMIDLNGRIKAIKYKNITSYNSENETLGIQEESDIYRIKKRNFHNAEHMIQTIEAKYLIGISK